jgi:hypothetical protein
MVANPTSCFRARTNGSQTKLFFNFVFFTGENRQWNQRVLQFFPQNPALSFCVMGYTREMEVVEMMVRYEK